MSLESILEHILNEANSNREKILQEAREKKTAILQQTKQEATKLYQEMLAKEKAAYLTEKERLMVNARLEARMALLAAKQEVIGMVFEKVKSFFKKEEFKKEQVLKDKVRQAAEDLDFYLNRIKLDSEKEIAQILFE